MMLRRHCFLFLYHAPLLACDVIRNQCQLGPAFVGIARDCCDYYMTFVL